jgi:hypothetical protein
MNSPCTILAALEYTAQTRRRPEGRFGTGLSPCILFDGAERQESLEILEPLGFQGFLVFEPDLRNEKLLGA